MENILQVVFMMLFLSAISAVVLGFRFIKKMINPNFRKKYFELKKISEQLKYYGHLKQLLEFKPDFDYKKKYKILYDNDNRIENDELYNSKYDPLRKEYMKTIEIINYFNQDINVSRSLKNQMHSGNPLISYLRNEIHRINMDITDEKLNKNDKILNSKKRFISYLIKIKTEDTEYLEKLLNDIERKK